MYLFVYCNVRILFVLLHYIHVMHIGRIRVCHSTHTGFVDGLYGEHSPIILWFVKIVHSVIGLTIRNHNVGAAWL